jgi:molybdopterin-binding protein
VSIITKKSAESLGLKPGGKAYAVIKASNVMIGVD